MFEIDELLARVKRTMTKKTSYGIIKTIGGIFYGKRIQTYTGV